MKRVEKCGSQFPLSTPLAYTQLFQFLFQYGGKKSQEAQIQLRTCNVQSSIGICYCFTRGGAFLSQNENTQKMFCYFIHKSFSSVIYFHSGASSLMYCGLETKYS